MSGIAQPNVRQLLQTALAHHQSGRPKEAEALYRQVLALDANNADALHLMGLLAYQHGNLQVARDLMGRAMALAPNVSGFCSNYAEVLRVSGKPADAAAMARRAAQLDPKNADAWGNLGIALYDMGKKAEAVPNYQRALALRPNFRDALNNLGTVLKELKRHEDAIPVFRRCIAHYPEYIPAYNNLGNVFEAMGRFNDAIDCYNKVLALDANCLEAHNNLAVTYDGMGKYDLAVKHYRRAVELNPRNARCHFNLALTLLRIGEMLEGWREYEWRWQCTDFPSERRNFPQPLWDGTQIEGKTLLVYAEQGKGDAIQFARYLNAAKAKSKARTLVEVPADLVPLIKQIPGIDLITSRVGPQTPFDVQIPFLSLPLALGMAEETLASTIPYLKADPDRVEQWKQKLGALIGDRAPRVKVGMVWAGNPTHVRDRARSSKLGQWGPLGEVKEALFVSLQMGAAASQLKTPPAGMWVVDPTPEIKNFADTAAIIEQLDLVISVDTAVVHLAGAMGKPTWLLTPYVPDWRWLEEREDTAWYPTVRLLRQTKLEDWTDVMVRAAGELRGMVKGKGK